MKSLGEFWKFWGTVVVSLETGEQSWSLVIRLASTLGILEAEGNSLWSFSAFRPVWEWMLEEA